MPGLLQSTDSGVASLKFVAAFLAELIGVLLFTLYGSAAGRNSVYAAWGNGIALVVLGTFFLSCATVPSRTLSCSLPNFSCLAQFMPQQTSLGATSTQL